MSKDNNCFPKGTLWLILIINCIVSVLLIMLAYYLYGTNIFVDLLAVVIFAIGFLNLMAWMKRLIILINTISYLNKMKG